MKYIFSSLAVILFLSCNSDDKIKLEPNFLIGGEWCGISELAGGQICLEFLDQKAYLRVKNEKFYNPLNYIIHEIDQKAQTISWEFSGEGTINVFQIKSQDSLKFKQEGAENSYVFTRSKVKYSD